MKKRQKCKALASSSGGERYGSNWEWNAFTLLDTLANTKWAVFQIHVILYLNTFGKSQMYFVFKYTSF